MNTQNILCAFTVLVLGAGVIGCKEEQKAASAAVETTTETASNALNQASDAVKRTVESAKETGAKV